METSPVLCTMAILQIDQRSAASRPMRRATKSQIDSGVPSRLALMKGSQSRRSSTEWPAVIGPANTELFEFSFSEAGLDRSDQYCFYRNGRPVAFLQTGLHGEYHTPADDVGLIEEDGMVRIGEFTLEVLENLIFRAAPLSYDGDYPPIG